MSRMTDDELSKGLDKLSPEALCQLVKQMLNVEPSLRRFVERNLTPQTAAPFDPAPMKRRADAIFNTYEPGWKNSRFIERLLYQLVTTPQQLEATGRGRAAASDYAGLLLSVVEHIEWQEECEYDYVLEQSTQRLRAHLEREHDEEIRTAIVDVFGDVLGFELTTGYGLAPLVSPTFLAYASTEQRRAVMKRVCEHLRQEQRTCQKSPYYYERSTREWLAKLLPDEDPADWIPSATDALPQLIQRVEDLIAKKSSHDYGTACNWLKRIHEIYRADGNLEPFHDYIRMLRREYPRRRALMNALEQAGF